MSLTTVAANVGGTGLTAPGTSGNILTSNGTAWTSAANTGAKAWVNFNGTGTVSIRDSFNVSSITDNATGDYTINFTNALPNNNYAMAGSSLLVAGVIGVVCENLIGPIKTTTAYRIAGLNTVTQGYADLSVISVAIFSS
jgi:hypothetical protein